MSREIWECLELMMGGRDITTERDETKSHEVREGGCRCDGCTVGGFRNDV